MNAPAHVFAGWNEASVATMHKLWLDGLSAREIAAALGSGCTRNAVIGKLHRTKLFSRDAPKMNPVRPGKPAPARRPETRIVRTYPKAKPAPPARPVPAPEIAAADPPPKIDPNAPLPKSRPVVLFDLKPHHCRWPLGDPKIETFRFCGAPRDGEHVYCAAHRLAALRPKEA